MLQSHVELCCIGSDVAHRLRRHTPFLVASELVSDVEVGSPERTHVATMNNKLIRLRRISAFLPSASRGGIHRRAFMNVHRQQDIWDGLRVYIEQHFPVFSKWSCL